MTQKFDSKVYHNKNRIYRPVPGATNILRLWVWSAEKKEYRMPERGNVFDARRYEYNGQGGRRRVKRYFETLEEARAWQNYAGGIPSPSTTQNTSLGNSFASNSPIESATEHDPSAASQAG